jgi:eukaryotic-like serine/threonine-protein kinase
MSEAAPPPGGKIGRFLIVDVRGRGGMGVVFGARDPQLDRLVALKLVRPDKRGDEARARLLREAHAMARLSHPNVVTVYEAGEHEDQIYLAMELVDGPNLSRWLRARRRGWREVRDMFVLVGRGLAAAHAAGLVHRDFKPDNVIVTAGDVPKVGDFGLAKLVGDPGEGSLSPSPASASVTQAGAVFGTPRYMAPEQHHGVADPRADQFAFCRALEEALALEQQSQAVAAVSTVDVEAPTPELPVVAASSAPRWLRAIIARGLSPQPEDRWPSMPALLDALARDPGAGVRRVLLVAGSLGVAAAIGVVATRLVGTSAPCDPALATSRLGGIWDAPVRQRLDRAFAETKLPYASVSAASVASRLDHWSGEWRAAYTATCEATHVRHEQSPELLDLRMACLDARLAELRALVGVLASADAKIVETSVPAAHKLSSLAACADGRALTGIGRPPDEARAATVRAQLAAAKAHGDAGKLAEARALADVALVGARDLGWRPLLAEALVRDAYAHGAAGENPAPMLLEATLAAEASRHDRVAAEAWVQLVFAVVLGRTDDARADEWAQRAAAALERVGGDVDLEARLVLNRGAVAYQRGKYPEALGDWQRAGELWRGALPPGHPDLARVDNNLGIVLEALGRFDEAETHYRRALDSWEKAFGPTHPFVASALSNLGSLLRTRGDLAGAVTALRRAVAIQEQVLPADHPSLTDPLVNLGNALLAQHDPGARAIYERALGMRERKFGADHPSTASVLVSLAAEARSRGELDRALELAERALAIYLAKTGADHPDTAIAQTSVGEVRLSRGDLRAGVTHFTAALASFEKHHGPTHPNTAYALSGLGRCLLALGRGREALPFLERAVAIRKTSPEKEPLAESELALGQALRATGGDAGRAQTLETGARQVLTGRLDPDQRPR